MLRHYDDGFPQAIGAMACGIYTDIPFGPPRPEKCELQVLAGGRSVFMIPSVCVVVMFNGECGWGSVYV